MKIKAVLYDMDGTLLDTEKLHKRAWTVTAAKRGVTMGPEFYQGAMGRNLTRVFALIEELYPNIGDIRSLYEEKEALCRKWMEEGGVPVLPGVYHTLGLLKALGVKQCVCTSTSRDSAEKTLTSAGILPKLDALMCGDDLEKSKPDPQIFLRGAQKLNTPIEECAVVGRMRRQVWKRGCAPGRACSSYPACWKCRRNLKRAARGSTAFGSFRPGWRRHSSVIAKRRKNRYNE